MCSDVFKKPKLDSHAARCHGAYYTCIDCSKTFIEGQWKDHTVHFPSSFSRGPVMLIEGGGG